jgi:geranylgeranyl reductase family protein
MKADVLVVGSGPAGSTAAKNLAENGFSVLLIDKEIFPRDKPCGGGLTPWVLKRFPYVKETNTIESYSYGGYLYSPSSRYKVGIHRQEPVIAMVLRKKFDNALVRLAIDKGTQFQDGRKAIDVKITPDKAQVTLDDGGTIKAEIVIGADGCLSTIARKTNLFSTYNHRCISVVEEFPLPVETMDEFFTQKRVCHIHLERQGSTGYGWVFPKNQHLNIGLLEHRSTDKTQNNKDNLRESYGQYLTILKNDNIIPKDIKSSGLRGGVIPIWPQKKTYTDRVLLCGDAAGFINPLSGEGIYYAMTSGQLASQIAVEALENEDTSEQFLSKYEQLWEKDFGRDIKLPLKSTKQLRSQKEKFIKIISHDEKLTEMLFLIMTGQASVYKLRWKLLKQYLYASLKYKLKGKEAR